MLRCDVADSSLASFYQEESIAEDAADVLAEIIEEAGGKVPPAAKKRINEVLHGLVDRLGTGSFDKLSFLTEAMHLLSGSRSRRDRIKAANLLALIGRQPKSGEELGREERYTRANINKVLHDIASRAPRWLLDENQRKKLTEASERARKRATRVHQEKRNQIQKTDTWALLTEQTAKSSKSALPGTCHSSLTKIGA